MSYTVHEETTKFINGISAVITIESDDDSEDPREWGGLESRIKTFYDGRSLGQGLEEEGLIDHGHDLQVGNPVFLNGTVYYGLEKYSHSGDSYAICSQGNFPDRQWDVIPLCGWISLDPENDSDLLKPLTGMAKIEKRINGAIGTFNDWCCGNVWGFTMELTSEDGDILEEESCWGFLGDSKYCLQEATASMYYLAACYYSAEELGKVEGEFAEWLRNRMTHGKYETIEHFCENLANNGEMTPVQLKAKHGVDYELPAYSKFDWKQEVASESTVLGYWEWIELQEEAKENDQLHNG